MLKELGVHEKIDAGGFPRKMGAVFVWGDGRSPWDADFNKKNWTRQILAIVETGFLKANPSRDKNIRRAEAEIAREDIPDDWIPRLVLRIEKQTTFLPVSADGRLHPACRYRVVKSEGLDAGDDAANPRRGLRQGLPGGFR